jgi:hypothetical protein
MNRKTRTAYRSALAALALAALVGCSGGSAEQRDSENAFTLADSVVSMFNVIDGYNTNADAVTARAGVVESLDSLPRTSVEYRGPDVELRVGEAPQEVVVCVTKSLAQGEWGVVSGPCLA